MPTKNENQSNEVPALAEDAFTTSRTPHRDKLIAALENPKARDDVPILREALAAYERWSKALYGLQGAGRERVDAMVRLLNEYKNLLEVDLILERGSAFLTRQKGQMKLDNSVLEEFLIHLVRPEIVKDLPDDDYLVGPQRAFMSLAFMPASFASLFRSPDVEIKTKDQDFILGANVNYGFSSGVRKQGAEQTGTFAIAAMAAECKVNLDKTMFQEAAGTASRLKQGCPFAKYYLIVEYLDMTPEDVRLTAIDNVFVIRKARRLPFERRTHLPSVRAQRQESPISAEVVWRIVEQMQSIVSAVWYDPAEVLRRGSFA